MLFCFGGVTVVKNNRICIQEACDRLAGGQTAQENAIDDQSKCSSLCSYFAFDCVAVLNTGAGRFLKLIDE